MADFISHGRMSLPLLLQSNLTPSRHTNKLYKKNIKREKKSGD